MKLLIFILTSLLAPAQLRINPTSFGMEEWELRTLLQPTLDIFPKSAKSKTPPLYISHHPDGPITLFERTPRGEVAIQLNSHDRYYSQVIYQFAHELAHVHANFQPIDHENKWLEEVFCEVASLYALRKLAIHWEKNAPNETLKNYRQSLSTYATKVIQTRVKLTPKTAPAFYQKHKKTLRSTPLNRPLNGAFANLILPLLEANPTHWQTLPHFPRKKGATLPQHFTAWRQATPKKHHPFLNKIENLFLKNPKP